MTTKLRARGPWWELAPVIRNREPFTTHGALHGEDFPPSAYELINLSMLPRDLWESVEAADYVVYSYSTPIAWHTLHEDGAHNGCWTIPDVKYSVTTTAHQHKVMTALLAPSD